MIRIKANPAWHAALIGKSIQRSCNSLHFIKKASISRLSASTGLAPHARSHVKVNTRQFSLSTSLFSRQTDNLAPRGIAKEVLASEASALNVPALSKPPPSWLDRLPASLRWTRPYFELARLDKPIGSWLLYWPCAWSITMAAYSCSFPISSTIYQLLLFGTGAVVMRGAGCTINDLWDRDIDNKVERTRLRPLASKAVTPFQAISFLGLQLSVGLAILTQLNLYSIFLGAASLSVVVIYPLMKRITYWPQFVLGLAFNWGALLGSSAILGHTNWEVALPLYMGSIAWTLVYDTIYAHQDKTDDIHASVKSTALLFGDRTVPVLSVFSAGFLSLLSYAGYLNAQGVPFYAISVVGGAMHLFWQLKGLKINDRADCWMRFKANRDFGFIVWSGLWADYMMKMLL